MQNCKLQFQRKMGKNIINFVNVAELLIIQEDMKFMNGKKKVYDHRELEIKKLGHFNWDK